MLLGDLLAVAVAQHRFQHDADRDRQARDLADAGLLERGQRVELAGAAARSGKGCSVSKRCGSRSFSGMASCAFGSRCAAAAIASGSARRAGCAAPIVRMLILGRRAAITSPACTPAGHAPVHFASMTVVARSHAHDRRVVRRLDLGVIGGVAGERRHRRRLHRRRRRACTRRRRTPCCRRGGCRSSSTSSSSCPCPCPSFPSARRRRCTSWCTPSFCCVAVARHRRLPQARLHRREIDGRRVRRANEQRATPAAMAVA